MLTTVYVMRVREQKASGVNAEVIAVRTHKAYQVETYAKSNEAKDLPEVGDSASY